jgi:hypothetical protein
LSRRRVSLSYFTVTTTKKIALPIILFAVKLSGIPWFCLGNGLVCGWRLVGNPSNIVLICLGESG